MTAACLVIGFAFFSITLISHLLIWRFCRIAKEIFYLMLIFLLIVPLLLGGIFIASRGTFGEFCASLMVYLSFSLAYLQTYSALKAEIPTFRILRLIHDAKTEGLDGRTIHEKMQRDHQLYGPKVTELENDRLLIRQKDRFVLSNAGAFMADTFIIYRRFLGLKTGLG